MENNAFTQSNPSSQALSPHSLRRKISTRTSTRRRLRFYTRGVPVMLSIGAVMMLGASPAGEFLGPESAEAARTATSVNSSAECQIKGSAYVDENGLSGAVLSLRGRTNWFHANADRSGRFAVSGLPAGPVVINIESPRAAERFGPARRTVTVGPRCVSIEAIALVPEQTEFASFG